MTVPEPTWLGVLVAIGAAAGALTAAGVLSRIIVRSLRRWDRIFTDIAGQPADPEHGLPRRPSLGERMGAVESGFKDMCSRMTTVEHQVSEIDAQLRPNGGKSFRDAVDRIARSSPDSRSEE